MTPAAKSERERQAARAAERSPPERLLRTFSRKAERPFVSRLRNLQRSQMRAMEKTERPIRRTRVTPPETIISLMLSWPMRPLCQKRGSRATYGRIPSFSALTGLG
jgi:hypothetical protein